MHLPRSVFWICLGRTEIVRSKWMHIGCVVCSPLAALCDTSLNSLHNSNTQPFCSHSSQVIDNAPKDLLLSRNGPAYSCDQSNQSNQAKNKLKLVWSLLHVRSEIMLGECVCVSFFGLLPNALVGRSHDLSCYWVSLAIRHLSAGAVSIDNSGVLNGDPQNR